MLQPSVPAWFEIPAQDLDRAFRFYESVLDAKLTREDQGSLRMAVFPHAEPYPSGALVKAGQLIAAALTGGPRLGFVPNLLMWAALVAGALLGAVAYHWINLAAIWFAAAFALALSAVVALTVHR